MPSPTPNRSELPAALWLWFPLTLLATQYLVRAWDESTYLRFIRAETGLIENLTVLFLAIAVITGLDLLRRRSQLPFRWMTPWLVMICLGSFYFMGEEASWGQHWFGWDAPESIAEANKQQETNFHNNTSLEWLLDWVPRNLLSAAVGIGGFFVPLIWRGSRRWSEQNYRHWLWPTFVCLPAAAIASFLNIPPRLFALAGSELPSALDIGAGETEEWALAFVIMIYLLSLRSRLNFGSK